MGPDGVEAEWRLAADGRRRRGAGGEGGVELGFVLSILLVNSLHFLLPLTILLLPSFPLRPTARRIARLAFLLGPSKFLADFFFFLWTLSLDSVCSSSARPHQIILTRAATFSPPTSKKARTGEAVPREGLACVMLRWRYVCSPMRSMAPERPRMRTCAHTSRRT